MSDNTPYERYVKQGIFKLTESEVETKNGNKVDHQNICDWQRAIILGKEISTILCLTECISLERRQRMDENKTGVWIQNSMNGKIIKYNPRDDMAPFNVGDVVEVENDDVYAMFKN